MDRKKFLRTSLLGTVGLGLASTYVSCKKDDEEMEAVSNINCNSTNDCVTKCDEEGPFFKQVQTNNTDMTQLGPGDSASFTNNKEKIKISGRLLTGVNCDEPVANGVIHIWHADPDGHYDVKESSPGAGDAIPDPSVQINFRTMLTSNMNGEYSFITYLPFGYYDRPRHIHLKVIANGYKELTTQIYFEGDPKLIPGNFSGGISATEANRIDNDRKLTLAASSGIAVDKEGIFNIKIEKA